MNIDYAKKRYQNDPMFHRVVDTILSWIHCMNVTPSEARDAAMLASIMHEERTIRNLMIQDEPPHRVICPFCGAKPNTEHDPGCGLAR